MEEGGVEAFGYGIGVRGIGERGRGWAEGKGKGDGGWGGAGWEGGGVKGGGGRGKGGDSLSSRPFYVRCQYCSYTVGPESRNQNPGMGRGGGE